MPNRMLRDWTESERVDKLSTQAEVFFTRLIMKVDDYGCIRANEKLLKSALFPLKDSIRDADLFRWMTECQKSDLIVVYEVSGKRYMQIKEFGQRKRQMNLKHPLPNDGDLRTIDGNPPTDDGLKRREVEKEEEGKENARAREDVLTVFNAEEEISKNPIRFEQLVMNEKLNASAGREILHKYHLFVEEKNQYPKTKRQVWAGFEKWLINEKNFNNGTYKRNHEKPADKLGTSDARMDALKKWGKIRNSS